MSSPSWPVRAEDEQLWEGLTQHIRDTLGFVGVAKMLGARTDHEAMLIWLSSVMPEVEKMARRCKVDVVGPALLAVDESLSVQLDIHHAVISRGGVPRVSTAIRLGLGAIALALAGRARWGDDWSHALEAIGQPRQVVEADPRPGWDMLPWVAQNPRGPAPSLTAMTPDEARDAGLADDVGYDVVAALFTEFERG